MMMKRKMMLINILSRTVNMRSLLRKIRCPQSKDGFSFFRRNKSSKILTLLSSSDTKVYLIKIQNKKKIIFFFFTNDEYSQAQSFMICWQQGWRVLHLQSHHPFQKLYVLRDSVFQVVF